MQAMKNILETIDGGANNLNNQTAVHGQGGLPHQQSGTHNYQNFHLKDARALGALGQGVMTSSQNIHSHSESFLVRNQIELKNGRAQKVGQFSHQSNSVQYFRYNGLKGAWFLLVDSLTNWDNLIAIVFISFIFAAGDEMEMSPFFPVVIFLINVVIQALVNVIGDLKIKNACKQVNQCTVQRYVVTQRKHKAFSARTWESLKPGDIIKIKENEEFPADVLILDSSNHSNDHKCYVSGGFTDDFNVPTLKKAHEGTQNKTGMKMAATKFVEQISGVVKYEYNYNGYFSGNIKLSNNPVALGVTLENVVVKGSYLCETKSVICLVLNVESQSMGNFDKGMTFNMSNITLSNLFAPQNSILSLFQSTKPIYDKKFYNPMRYLQVFLMLVFLVAASIGFFQQKLSTGSTQYKFVKVIVEFFNDNLNPGNASDYIQEILALTSGLFIALPLNFKIIMDVITLNQANLAEWDYNCVPASLRINRSYAVKALGNISNVFMTTNAIMSHNVKKAKILQINNHWYFDSNAYQNTGADERIFDDNLSEQIDSPRVEAKPASFGGTKSTPQKMATKSSFRNYQFPFSNNTNQQASPKNKNEQKSPMNGKAGGEESSSIDSPHDFQMPSQAQQNLEGTADNEFDTTNNFDDFLPNQDTFSHRFHNKKLKKDLKALNKKEHREKLQDLLKAIVLCHHATKREETDTESKSLYKSIHSEEESHLMLAHTFDYNFLQRHSKSISVSLGTEQKQRYDIMVTHSFMFSDQLISISVIKPLASQDYTQGATLFAKGPMSAMMQFLEETDQAHRQYLEDMKKYADYGIFPTMFLQRKLNPEEATDLESRINNANALVKDQEDKIESSLKSYMFELKVLGVVGTQEIFNFRDTLVIEDMMRNGVKVWLMSKDDEIVHTVNCNAMRLLQTDSTPMIINGDNEKDVEEQVKRCLYTLSEGQQIDEKGKLKYTFTQQLSQGINAQAPIQQPKKKQSKGKLKPSTTPKIQSQRGSLIDDLQDSKRKKKVLMLTGQALNYIFRDESLLKCLLTICTFSDLILGSSIRPSQQAELIKSSKSFAIDGSNQYTMALISSAQDQQIMAQADVSVVLSTSYQRMSTLQIRADIVMNSIYPLTYLLFKHGTQSQRRIKQTTKMVLYRTFFLAIIMATYMSMQCFSGSIPVKTLMLIMFYVLVSPIQIVIFGFSHRDVGFDYLYRIYGEYQRNFMSNMFSRSDILTSIWQALLDSLVFYMASIQEDHIVLPNGRALNQEGFQLFQGIILYIFMTFALTNMNESVLYFHVTFFLLNIFGIVFVLDDEYLIALKTFVGCPIIMLYLLFTLLYCILRNYVFDVVRKLAWPKSRERFEFYTDIEDRLFLEEYEDPDQEFLLEVLQQDYIQIAQKMAQRKMTVINQNLMKLPRSESMDLIIEKLNELHSGLSMKKFQDQAILNWFTLKFNDQNKEIEYLESRTFDKVRKFRKVLAITIVFNCFEIIKEIALSSLNRIPFASFWFFFGYCIINLVTLATSYRLQKLMQIINLALMIFLCVFYSFCYYFIENVEFSIFMVIFLYVYSLHGTYIRLIMAIAVCFLIMHMSFLNSNFLRMDDYQSFNEQRPPFTLPYIATFWACYLICWSLFIYWEEKSMRLDYWQGYKKIKEYSKLKSILHILMPAFIRERIRQGQRFIADDQGEVSIIFCDIAEFDTIVQMFTGRELCELLDNIYNAFDQLCEQNGLQKIETVGKTYMACGGLKQSEKKVDQRLLNKHHSVRVVEFANNMLNFIRRQTLKDGSALKVKIGIHTGNVISGVVGENKPQFSLIGDTVNKTSRVCSKCKENQILVSKETHKLLEEHSNMYSFERTEADMKGIGKEWVYQIKKRSNPQITSYQQVQAQRQKEQLASQNKKKRLSSRHAHLSNSKGPSPKMSQPIAAQAVNRRRTAHSRDNQISHGRVARLNKVKPIADFGNVNSNNYGPDYFQAGLYQPESSRSLVQEQNSVENGNQDPLDFFNRSYQGDDENQMYKDGNDSMEEKHNNLLHFGEFKDDRAIFKNPVENTQYNLIERPSYLLSFNQNQYYLEEQFRIQLIKQGQWRKFVFLAILIIYNKIALAFYLLEIKTGMSLSDSPYYAILYVYIVTIVLLEGTILWRIRAVETVSPQTTSYLIMIYFIILLSASGSQFWRVANDSRLAQIYLMENMFILSFVFFISIIQLRQVLIIYTADLIIWITVISGCGDSLTVKSYSYALEMLFYLSLFTLKCHQKEMAKRKIHNRKIIIDFEIKKTNSLLGNLVPPPVLTGIKNDQKVVDELEDVTLLFTDMVGFTQFSNNVKNPKEVVKLVSELFTGFDQLCVQNKVYKVHTIGDCYVIMGYTGHISQQQRTPEIKAEEAFRVIQTAFEMIGIIEEVRKHSDNPDLKDLNMRIGVHTGKIVAGIIGTKLVRYDIFGGDVLIANKMESNGIAGQVVVSEDTKRLLMIDPLFSESLDFRKHRTVELQGIKRTVEAFIVAPREETIGDNSSISGGGHFAEHLEEEQASDFEERVASKPKNIRKITEHREVSEDDREEFKRR